LLFKLILRIVDILIIIFYYSLHYYYNTIITERLQKRLIFISSYLNKFHIVSIFATVI